MSTSNSAVPKPVVRAKACSHSFSSVSKLLDYDDRHQKVLSTANETHLSHETLQLDIRLSMALKMSFACTYQEIWRWNFLLIHIECPNGHGVHFFEPLNIATIGGSAKITCFSLVHECFLQIWIYCAIKNARSFSTSVCFWFWFSNLGIYTVVLNDLQLQTGDYVRPGNQSLRCN